MLKNNLFILLLISLIITSYMPVSSIISAKTKVETVEINQWKKTYDATLHYNRNYGDGVIYTITWKKVSNADGYQVNLYEKGNAGESWYKRVNDQKKCSASVSFSCCYAIKAKVRAYSIKNGKKIFGQWSKIVKKTVNL